MGGFSVYKNENIICRATRATRAGNCFTFDAKLGYNLSMAKEKKKQGRPERYRKEFDEMAFKLSLLGLTDEQMADVLDIHLSNFYRWQERHPSFREAIKKGKVPADAEVAKALFHRATGYNQFEEKQFVIDGEVITEPCLKHYPADTAAAFIWLKNRQKWTNEPKAGNEGTLEKLDEVLDSVRTSME
jgi:hypothetical protein